MFFSDLANDTVDTNLRNPTGNRRSEIEKFLSQIIIASCHLPVATNQWPEVAVELAGAFNVDPDVVRRRHVAELYVRRLDSQAIEVQMAVRDRPALGHLLISVLGRRLAGAMKNEANKARSLELITQFPPGVVQFINSSQVNVMFKSLLSLLLRPFRILLRVVMTLGR
eukprot:m.72719 g.72719  ORF g.72719 m.72719 type:complete len:168 (+) comp35808_c0_seq2:3444-3947(+)